MLAKKGPEKRGNIRAGKRVERKGRTIRKHSEKRAENTHTNIKIGLHLLFVVYCCFFLVVFAVLRRATYVDFLSALFWAPRWEREARKFKRMSCTCG